LASVMDSVGLDDTRAGCGGTDRAFGEASDAAPTEQHSQSPRADLENRDARTSRHSFSRQADLEPLKRQPQNKTLDSEWRGSWKLVNQPRLRCTRRFEQTPARSHLLRRAGLEWN